MKNPNQDPNKNLEIIRQIENSVEQPLFDLENREDFKVKIRVNEQISPAKFKSDPIIPGGYLANSLTIKAMRSDIFILGDSFEDLETPYLCQCGEKLDLQFWKLCPYCGRTPKP